MILTDKQLHFLAGCTIAAVIHPFGLLPAAIALIIFAVGKEAYDHTGRGTVDIYDAVATVVGGAVMLGWTEIARSYA